MHIVLLPEAYDASDYFLPGSKRDMPLTTIYSFLARQLQSFYSFPDITHIFIKDSDQLCGLFMVGSGSNVSSGGTIRL